MRETIAIMRLTVQGSPAPRKKGCRGGGDGVTVAGGLVVFIVVRKRLARVRVRPAPDRM